MSSTVYFLPVADSLPVAEQAKAMGKIFQAAQAASIISERDFVAIKIHVGEKENTTHVQPAVVKEVVDAVWKREGQPFLTETSTLYRGERENAVKHILHAQRHGFGIAEIGAPFIMADGLTGNTEYEVPIYGKLHQSVKIARGIMNADVLITISHPTGHPASGLGACIKNLGMGLASRMGKMRQHSSMLPEINTELCTLCRKCIKWCPRDTIVEKNGSAFIVKDSCIGCGECLAVCQFDAVKYDWNAESGFMQKSMAEHAYGVVKDKEGKAFHFNVMINMTKDCDCFSVNQKKFIPDIGILASTDPVAIDMATMELTEKHNGCSLAKKSYPHHDAMIQIRHAEEIGMGSTDYRLVEVK